jgi:hypothetical protein
VLGTCTSDAILGIRGSKTVGSARFHICTSFLGIIGSKIPEPKGAAFEEQHVYLRRCSGNYLDLLAEIPNNEVRVQEYSPVERFALGDP